MDSHCFCIIQTFAGTASPFHRFSFWHFTTSKRRVQKGDASNKICFLHPSCPDICPFVQIQLRSLYPVLSLFVNIRCRRKVYKLHLKSSKSSIFLFLGIVLMPFFYFPVFFGFRIKKDYTNNCFFPFAFCSTVFLFLKNVFLLIKCVLLFVFDSLRTIDSKKKSC